MARFAIASANVRVGPEREVVGIAGGVQQPGPRQRQPAIEVDPGELRPLHGAGREVAGRLEESALRIVAVAHHEPGPERGAVEPEGLAQCVLGGARVAVGEQGRAEERPVVAGGRPGLGGQPAVAFRERGFTQLGMVARPLVEQRRGDVVADPLGEVELVDRPPEGVLPVGFGAAARGQPDAGARLEDHQLDGLLAHPALLGVGEPGEPAGGGAGAPLVELQSLEEAPGLRRVPSAR